LKSRIAAALAQEFRIGRDHHIARRIGFADQPLDLVAGTDRHGRFGDHHREPGKRAAISRAAAWT
jgi:hypothetical protein